MGRDCPFVLLNLCGSKFTVYWSLYRKYPKLSRLDHTWVAHRWLADIGLPQYSPGFEAQLVDGRLLNVLSRKDLERHLGVNRKFHQASLLHGVELLRRLDFDKEVYITQLTLIYVVTRTILLYKSLH